MEVYDNIRLVLPHSLNMYIITLIKCINKCLLSSLIKLIIQCIKLNSFIEYLFISVPN